MTSPPIHPDMHALDFLIGTWKGEGRGGYPTIESFTYLEQVTFEQVGKPFLFYQQKTSSPQGQPLHAEAGYFRAPGSGVVELVIAQPTGMAEIHAGQVSGSDIELSAQEVVRTPTAKSVTAVKRTISVDGDTMQYRLDMAAVGQPIQFHLAATLRRVSSSG